MDRFVEGWWMLVVGYAFPRGSVGTRDNTVGSLLLRLLIYELFVIPVAVPGQVPHEQDEADRDDCHKNGVKHALTPESVS